jgi:hypothetical protein
LIRTDLMQVHVVVAGVDELAHGSRVTFGIGPADDALGNVVLAGPGGRILEQRRSASSQLRLPPGFDPSIRLGTADPGASKAFGRSHRPV